MDNILTHCHREKVAHLWMDNSVFCLTFHWSLFPSVPLPISPLRFRLCFLFVCLFVCFITKSFLTYSFFFHPHLLYQPCLGQAQCVQSHQRQPISAVAITAWLGGLVPHKRQVIIWANDDPVHWRIYALLGRNVLMQLGLCPDVHRVIQWSLLTKLNLSLNFAWPTTKYKHRHMTDSRGRATPENLVESRRSCDCWCYRL